MSSSKDHRSDVQRTVASHWANRFAPKEVSSRPVAHTEGNNNNNNNNSTTTPDVVVELLDTTSDESDGELEIIERSFKKAKTQVITTTTTPIFNSSRLVMPSPVHVFKTKKVNPPNADPILSLFNSKLLKETYIFSFELDVAFVLSGMADPEHTKIHIISQHLFNIKEMSNIFYFNVDSIRRTQWCFHHSKLVINFYKDDTMQVFVSTSNFIPLEDEYLGGVYWKSELLIPNAQSTGKQDFKIDLCDYLSAYGKPEISSLIDKIKVFDFSTVKASFIGSVPGLSTGKFGYLQLQHHLSSKNLIPDTSSNYKRFKFLAQVSSIAGPFKQQNGEVSNILTHLLLPLALDKKFPLPPGEQSLNKFLQNENFEVEPVILFPTKEEIFASANINGGSGSLIYNNTTKPGMTQDKYLSKFFHKRNPTETDSVFVHNHSKIYLLSEDDFATLNWCLIGSMNLSKSAWGSPTKDGELRGGHWECGVLLDPKDYNSGGKFVPVFNENVAYGQNTAIRLPFKLPVYKYQPGDQAWCKFDPNMLVQHY